MSASSPPSEELVPVRISARLGAGSGTLLKQHFTVAHHFFVAHAAMLRGIVRRGVMTGPAPFHHFTMLHHLLVAHGAVIHTAPAVRARTPLNKSALNTAEIDIMRMSHPPFWIPVVEGDAPTLDTYTPMGHISSTHRGYHGFSRGKKDQRVP